MQDCRISSALAKEQLESGPKPSMHDDVIKWRRFPRYWPFKPGEFPAQRPVTRSFEVFFDLRPSKWLSKQSQCWKFETPSRPLWRHRNDNYTCHVVWIYIMHRFIMYSRWTIYSITQFDKKSPKISVLCSHPYAQFTSFVLIKIKNSEHYLFILFRITIGATTLLCKYLISVIC